MRAAVYVKDNEPLSIENVVPAEPGPRDVVIELGASGICHTDLSIQSGQMSRLLAGPSILGHEGAGTVVEVGKEVSFVKVGDKVISAVRPACGRCENCLRGTTHLCTALWPMLGKRRGARPDGTDYYAMSGLGTFCGVMTCDEASVVPVKSDLPFEQLALLGCGLTTGAGSVLFTANVEAGASVVIVGCGGVGQAAIQAAVVAGATPIIAVDPMASKREFALKLGATHAIDPTQGDIGEQVREITRGRGADYAFDVVGGPEVVAQTFRTIGAGGMLVLVGYGPIDAELKFPAFELQSQEKCVKGCVAGSAQIRRDFQRFVDLIETGRINTASMVSRTISLDQVNQALEDLHTGEAIRSVITAF
jgi:S-(hydroxymethyl)glutathione dehydrogenase/alcohol dehydrogenase